MKLRFIRISAALTTLVVVLSCGGADGLAPAASDNSAKVPASDATLLAGLTASGPVANASIGSNRGSVNASVGPSAEVSWVSLVAGTVPDGTTATVSNLRTAERLTVTIVDGGFDPQQIPASVGDTIEVTVNRVAKPDAAALLSVVPRPAPRVIRTRPPRGQTDVPLNMVITIVFSEPVDPASVNATSVTLTKAGSPVAGAVRLVPGPGYAVEFAPAALLAPGTSYTLTVSGVVNLAGSPLAAPASIAFTTSAVGTGSLAPSYNALELSFKDFSVVTGDTIEMRGYVHRGQGVSVEALEWTISDPSVASIRLVDTNLIEVRALRSGGVTISARTLGSLQELSARATLKVFARSSQPSPIVVDEFSVLEQIFAVPVFVYAPNLRLRDTSATGSARVIGITIDLPGANRRLYCAPNRIVGAASWTVFPPPGDQNGAFLSGQDFQRLPDIVVDATARVTAVLSDGLGVSFTMTGKIVRNFSSWSWTETGIYPPPCEYLAPR